MYLSHLKLASLHVKYDFCLYKYVGLQYTKWKVKYVKIKQPEKNEKSSAKLRYTE